MSRSPRRRTCACMHTHYRLCDQHPSFRKAQVRIEDYTGRCITSGHAMARRKPLKIPVMVHVVYRTDAENISDAQVKSQVAVLNRDFRAKNPDRSGVPAVWKGLVADVGIEFTLRRVTRTKTTRRSFGTGDKVKFAKSGGHDVVDPDRCLNIWVCNLGGGLLGYAQFPGGPKKTDGVVVLYTAFGTKGAAVAPFDKGRTTTHEIGHYLNLRHIWGDVNTCGGSDFVPDTPTQALPNYGSPSFPSISCNNGPSGDMFMNYMDYVDDAAMFMFTPGQAARMRATLLGPRKKLGRRAKKKKKKKK